MPGKKTTNTTADVDGSSDEATQIDDGKILDYITGKPVADNDKERVRQRIALCRPRLSRYHDFLPGNRPGPAGGTGGCRRQSSHEPASFTSVRDGAQITTCVIAVGPVDPSRPQFFLRACSIYAL
jgi:hypothetical protein